MEEGSVDSIYLDFQKAFDLVVHINLISKLKEKFKIGGKILVWIHEFLKNRVQTVKVDSHESEVANVLSFVCQGSVVGPVLFSLIIFDLQDHKRNVHSQVENEEKNDGTEENNSETDAW